MGYLLSVSADRIDSITTSLDPDDVSAATTLKCDPTCVAELRQMLRDHRLLYFDWKESMHEVLPMLAELLRKGPGVEFDIAPFTSKCDAWDKRSRLNALKEIAPAVPDVMLAEIKTDGDSYAIACLTKTDAARLRAWKKKAGLPLAPLG